MKKINIIFRNVSLENPEPQISVIYDTESNETKFYSLFLPESKNKISTIKSRINKICKEIEKGGVIINDLMSMMPTFRKFGMQISTDSDVYDIRYTNKTTGSDESVLKKDLIKGMLEFPNETKLWMKIKARSAIIYSELTSRGIMWGPHHEYPIYDTNTTNGRSRARGFNIQGCTKDDPIRHINDEFDYFICLDWVAADMRVAGLLSGDEFINNSFIESDPYSEIERLLDSEDIDRDDCKIEMLKSIYGVDLDNPLLDITPKLKKWMETKKDEFENNNIAKTIFGMPIKSNNIKTSLSGIISGSIAEAIQNVLVKISKSLGSEYILTEIHDSLILCCPEDEIQRTINIVYPIMKKPYDNIDVTFPVGVSVGKKWKQWKRLKIFR